jgi:hydroxymethylpyrimidine pyrophosphatase-like HAD family hydrolase
MAFGDSDGELEMLERATTGKGPRFGPIVHHTDADCEYAYDRKAGLAT